MSKQQKPMTVNLLSKMKLMNAGLTKYILYALRYNYELGHSDFLACLFTLMLWHQSDFQQLQLHAIYTLIL